jgi:hypothetical protein
MEELNLNHDGAAARSYCGARRDTDTPLYRTATVHSTWPGTLSGTIQGTVYHTGHGTGRGAGTRPRPELPAERRPVYPQQLELSAHG